MAICVMCVALVSKLQILIPIVYLLWNAENVGLDVDSETVQIGTDVMDDDNVGDRAQSFDSVVTGVCVVMS